ncbi:juvenile hormone acid O-methyltransferase-like [Schistocerca americana]|uniref:juvenile hormone acid O-methyltransferase-like n=1 Tax=Schistocerca americana TaxID=7009 RepID=UPI001F4FC189|nr:juvenile hormone acid O-methyltransferase-like [Schistocerca americana]
MVKQMLNNSGSDTSSSSDDEANDELYSSEDEFVYEEKSNLISKEKIILKNGIIDEERDVEEVSGNEMEDAELYATSSSLQQEFVSQVLDELWPSLSWLSEEGTVLDVGCGPGDVTFHELLSRLPPDFTVVAADISANMLAKASSRFSGPRVRFCQLDIGTANIEDTRVWQQGPFSKVFSFFCLNWVQDQSQALRNIRKLLSPGGETVLVIVSYSPIFAVFEALAKTSRWSAYMVDYRQFVTPYQFIEDPERKMRNYLQEIGFTVKTCRDVRDVTYTSKDERNVINTVTAINPFVRRIPKELREPFLQDYVREGYRLGALARHSLPDDGGCCYTFHYGALVVHAVRA